MQQDPVAVISPGPFNGPFEICGHLALAIGTAPFEGIWFPSRWSKYASVELLAAQGTITGVELDLWGSNSVQDPVNTYTVTVGGTVTTGDTLTLTFNNPNLPNNYPVAYTATGTDTVNTIAAALAAAVQADAKLAPLGFLASANGAVVTITFPSASGGLNPWDAPSPTTQPPSNATLLTTAVGGSATESLTVGLGTDGVKMQSLAQIGAFAPVQALTRWIKGRLVTLTGSGTPQITAQYHGVA
jgi:hypothetical protein